LAPLLVGVSLLLLARAHYVLYVRKRGGRGTAIVTWSATLLVAAFWSWKWIAWQF